MCNAIFSKRKKKQALFIRTCPSHVIIYHCLISCLGIFECIEHECRLHRCVAFMQNNKNRNHLISCLTIEIKCNGISLDCVCTDRTTETKFIDVRYPGNDVTGTIILLSSPDIDRNMVKFLWHIEHVIDQFHNQSILHWIAIDTLDKYLDSTLQLYTYFTQIMKMSNELYNENWCRNRSCVW